MLLGNGRQSLSFFQRKVGHHQSGSTGLGSHLTEQLHPHIQKRVGVSEQDHWNAQLSFEGPQHVQYPFWGCAC